MKRNFLFFLCLVGILVFVIGCDPPKERSNAEAISISAGVVVKGHISDGFIENTNDFPVRIKQVLIFKGETTQWIDVFKPGEQREQYIRRGDAFYVYTLDGVEIGWINPNGVGTQE